MGHLSTTPRGRLIRGRVIPRTDQPRRVILIGLLVASLLVALLAASQLINYGLFDLRFPALDTDTHASIFGVMSLLAEAAAAGALTWRGRRAGRRRWAWNALGAIVAGLIFVRTLTNFSAATVAAPVAVVFWLLCWLTYTDRPSGRTVIWAALFLMAGSLVLHQVGLDADVLNYSGDSWAYQITAVAKHGCELAGWLLLATGAVAGGVGRPAPQRRDANNRRSFWTVFQDPARCSADSGAKESAAHRSSDERA